MPAKKNIGLLIKQINNNYERELNKYLRQIDLTASQYEVLDYLMHSKEKEICIKDVQKALNYKQPTVTGILARLEEKEFVYMSGADGDKRCKNIHLKDSAYDIRKKMEKEKKRAEQLLTDGMSVEEKNTIHELLKRVLDNIIE